MERLIEAFNEYGIPFSQETVEKFQRYMDKILELNEHINLTAIKEPEEFIQKHYVDSIALFQFDEIQNANIVLDLGTGAGFPGVPLAIIFPNKEFVLVDSLNKRLKIINDLCQELSIDNVTVVHGRAEELGRNKSYRDTFDICVSRAVASMPVLLEYCMPFVKKGGSLVAYKGPDVIGELDNSKKALKELSGQLDRIEKVNILNSELDHNLVFVKKISNTNKKYPRKAGTPSKEPLI